MIDGESGEKTFRTLVKSQDEVRINWFILLYKHLFRISDTGNSSLLSANPEFTYNTEMSLVNKFPFVFKTVLS